MNTYTPILEVEIEEIWLSLEIAFEEHGIRCDDGHWMTAEEFSQLSGNEILELATLVYGKSFDLGA